MDLSQIPEAQRNRIVQHIEEKQVKYRIKDEYLLYIHIGKTIYELVQLFC